MYQGQGYLEEPPDSVSPFNAQGETYLSSGGSQRWHLEHRRLSRVQKLG